MPRDLPPPLVLVFSASDPSSGAGMQADIMTLSSLGCHPLTAVTALTVQDSSGVLAVRPVDDGWLFDQARALLEDMPISAVKIGLTGSVKNIAAIARILDLRPDVPVVLDPVLASGRGDPLASSAVTRALVEQLLPRSTLITPNSLEARRLAAKPRSKAMPADLDACARALIERGAKNVLITGTHEDQEAVINRLYAPDAAPRETCWPRLPGSYHGSGCTLASAIAAHLASGLDLAEAVADAQEYTWQTLAQGFRPGRGQYFPDRFFWARELDLANDA